MGLSLYALLVGLLAMPQLGTLAYTLREFDQGSDFFSHWWFFTGDDPTNGKVNYLNMWDARSHGLAYATSNNQFVLAVDSWSHVPPGGKRNSVRITSRNAYTGGLFIMDAAAMPVGCATWPSFWTVGPNWPMAGEIDIVEGGNGQDYNQMTLHSGTTNTCNIDTSNQGMFSGHLSNPHCHSTPKNDSGCSILDSDNRSFGHGFNEARGGVFALLWEASNGMSMWHFARDEIPYDITNKAPNPSSWKKPSGFWSAQACDIRNNFYDHSMVFDITLCGWAGGSVFSRAGCPGTCSDMVANTSNFADAKWIINYVAVYH